MRVLANVGCGPRGGGRVPPFFNDWQQLRIDVDASVQPDLIADLTDLSPLPSNSVDALWASHCIEHLYEHDVPRALAEFHRVIREDGFICILVPDLQTVAQHIAADRLHETLYNSAAGPITPHDVLFGHGAAIAAGRTSMAHRSGFTPTLLLKRLQESGFAEITLRRRPDAFELVAVARKRPSRDTAERTQLMNALGL